MNDMIQEQLNALAREAGRYADEKYEREWKAGTLASSASWQSIRDERFADLVAAHEREKLAADFARQLNELAQRNYDLRMENCNLRAATPPASAAGERDVFIAWVEKEHPEFSTEGHADGGFLWATTEGLWQAWQARAALASKPLPEQVAQDSEPDCPNCSGPRFCTKRECNGPDAARTRGEGSGT